MPQPLIDLDGLEDGPILHLAPANGFVPQTYLPMLRPFVQRFRIVSLPPRALWGDGLPPPVTPDADWRTLADDLLAGLDAYGLEDIVAVGHSFGGIASMLALLKEPQRFRALILLDPTILTPDILGMLGQARQLGMTDHIPLVQGALRRRRHFASVDEAFDLFRSRKLFADWPDESLRFYAEYGTMPDPQGAGRVLTWAAEWEAYYFATGYLQSWDDLPRLNGLRPTLVLAGAESDTFVPESAQRAAALMPDARHESIPGHGHLFPLSAPQMSAERISAWLSAQGI